MKLADNVEYRNDGSLTTPALQSDWLDDEPIGWCNLQGDTEGWVIHNLDEYDTKWLQGENILTDNIYRYATNQYTGIIKIDIYKGTIAFVDIEHLKTTERVVFESDIKANKIIFDHKV